MPSSWKWRFARTTCEVITDSATYGCFVLVQTNLSGSLEINGTNKSSRRTPDCTIVSYISLWMVKHRWLNNNHDSVLQTITQRKWKMYFSIRFQVDYWTATENLVSLTGGTKEPQVTVLLLWLEAFAYVEALDQFFDLCTRWGQKNDLIDL